MKFFISSYSFSYHCPLPITFYQLPYTIYQLPVYPLDKCLAEKRLNGKKSVKNNGLPAVLIRCGLILQSYYKSVPGIWGDPGPGANPAAKISEYGPTQVISKSAMMLERSMLTDKMLWPRSANMKWRKTLLISKSLDGRV